MTHNDPLRTRPPTGYPSNETRATEGGEIVAAWRGWNEGGEVDDDIADVLAFIIHYCDRAGVDAGNAWLRAKHYHAEELDPASGVPGGPKAVLDPTERRS